MNTEKALRCIKCGLHWVYHPEFPVDEQGCDCGGKTKVVDMVVKPLPW